MKIDRKEYIKKYNQELSNMIYICKGWDSETNALQEAFDRGINFYKKINQ